MNKLILVSATAFEIEPTIRYLAPGQLGENLYRHGNWQIQICITGLGMSNTAFALGRLAEQQFDVAINAGLAGAFGDLKKGTVVSVYSDCFADLGAEDGEQFLSIDELGFGEARLEPKRPYRHAMISALPAKRGITVNTVHGNEQSIQKLLQRYPAEIESMEGAAFFMAANAFNWECVQIRAISNAVERRNRANWDIPTALKNLNDFLIALIKEL